MADETIDSNPGDIRWIAQEWAGALVRAIESLGGPSVTANLVDSAAQPPREAGASWWSQEFNVHTGPAVWIGASEEVWKRIGGHILSSLGVTELEDAIVQDTYREVIAQSLGAIATRLTEFAKREVTCTKGAFGLLPPQGAQPVFVRLEGNEELSGELCLIALPSLAQALVATAAPAPKPPARQAQATAEAPPPPTPPAPRVPAENRIRDFESALYLEMPVSLSLGRIRMTLDEALKLQKGTLIPLKQPVDAPGELKINRRAIARGRIVDIEGSYALTIEELIRPKEIEPGAGSRTPKGRQQESRPSPRA